LLVSITFFLAFLRTKNANGNLLYELKIVDGKYLQKSEVRCFCRD